MLAAGGGVAGRGAAWILGLIALPFVASGALALTVGGPLGYASQTVSQQNTMVQGAGARAALGAVLDDALAGSWSSGISLSWGRFFVRQGQRIYIDYEVVSTHARARCRVSAWYLRDGGPDFSVNGVDCRAQGRHRVEFVAWADGLYDAAFEIHKEVLPPGTPFPAETRATFSYVWGIAGGDRR